MQIINYRTTKISKIWTHEKLLVITRGYNTQNNNIFNFCTVYTEVYMQNVFKAKKNDQNKFWRVMYTEFFPFRFDANYLRHKK